MNGDQLPSAEPLRRLVGQRNTAGARLAWQLVGWHRKGKSVRTIAAELNLHPTQVHRILTNNRRRRQPGHLRYFHALRQDIEDWKELTLRIDRGVAELLAAGWSQQRLASYIGLTRSQVRTAASRSPAPLPPPPLPAPPPPERWYDATPMPPERRTDSTPTAIPVDREAY